ncbi:MAG: filamentous hemagglutinin N-terminal domain-containing protein, partial [Elsteraceae bacterium]
MYFRRKLFATTALIAAGLLSAATVSAQTTGPQGGAVAAGSASIAQSGRHTTITQSSAKAIVEWRSFDVDAGASVQFIQPGRDSIALNRVREGGASRIDGSVSANGQIYVVNPNGVLIGPTGRINAAGFVASTHDVRNQDFMAGKMDFSVTSPNAAARVRNEGVIAAGDGGYAVLAGSRVENAGVITARVGQVGLAGGDAVALDVVGDRLLQFQVTKPVSRDPGGAVVSNSGTLSAPGGVVTLTAQAARNVIRDVINTTGVIEAQGATVEGGRVIIHGGESGTVQVGGSIDVGNANGIGGQVDVRGEKVGLIDGAKIDASGAKGGGTVLIGGDWQGKGPGMTAQVAYVAPTASITVDATQTGDGGKAVVWADDTTRFNGSISAQGGAQRGDGGQVETSGKRALAVGPTAAVTTAARAPKAKPGAWLLDPTDITISAGGGVTSITSPYAPGGTSSVTPGAITAALATGAVTIQTGDGTITVASPISYAGAASSLTLTAGLD